MGTLQGATGLDCGGHLLWVDSLRGRHDWRSNKLQQYIDLLNHVLDNGHMVKTRNGNRQTVYGYQMRFDLTQGFPAVTTKRLAWKQVCTELCWFLNGRTDLAYLHERGCRIWDGNAGEDGELGRIYGAQWRDYNSQGLDQIQRSIDLLRNAPASTRNVAIAWNPLQQDAMKLPPCHFGFQVHSHGNKVILQVSLRSSDVILGLPFNVASYALLAHLFAHCASFNSLSAYPVMRASELIVDLGNVHIYESHIDGARLQARREPLPLPTLRIDGDVPIDLYGLEPEQFVLEGYKSHPAIKYELIV